MAELSKRVERLTTEHLIIVVQTLMQAPSLVIADDDFLTFGLATEVLRFFFGNAWTNENVFPMHKDVSSAHRGGRKFLRTEATDPEDQYRHMQRITTLAETVFNLQGIEGLRQRITLMDKDDLEAALGEMECAALLTKSDFHFRFITPAGVKGRDYEGEIVTSTGRTVCCEIKSRSEQGLPSHQTLWRTFEQARKQLPKGKPAMILVKLPEAWARDQDIRAIVEAATEKVLRQSHRIVAIIFIWEEWSSTPEDFRTVKRRIRPYSNRGSNLYAQDIDVVLSTMGLAYNPDWVQFRRVVESVRASR